jgi:hypothetical protein
MDMQEPEIIIIKSKEYKMTTLPLASYWNNKNPKPKLRFSSWCNIRRYVGKWTIRNHNLYPTNITGTCLELTPKVSPVPHNVTTAPSPKPPESENWFGKSLNLRVIFPHAHVSGQIAYWFTGDLKIGIGRGLIHFPFPFYKTLLIISIENGRVIKQETITRENPNKKKKAIT